MRRINAIVFVVLLAGRVMMAQSTNGAGGRVEVDLAGTGWSLWRDEKAGWQIDELFLPPVDLSKVPSNPPTGGWEQLGKEQALAVSVPGTVEQYLFKNYDPTEKKPANIYSFLQGVSWWYRTLRVPAVVADGRVLLRFEAVRQRAEVYVNRKLVGYDLVGNTPFEVDITNSVRPGEDCQLAVRITNPGGNWSWTDFGQIRWDRYLIPMSHSFGGITGGVKLLVVDGVRVDDVYVQNTPAMREVNVQLAVKNDLGKPAKRDLLVRVVEKANPAVEVFRQTLKDVVFTPGDNQKTVKVAVPSAKLWDLEHPNLYLCQVQLQSGQTVMDAEQRSFGFRWFALDGIGQNAMLRLNGKRIVLRTAISWGFWPTNGITPTPELAEKQVRTAKDLGMNMLNFHRCIGQPISMDKADEIGLLYFEEPGGYVAGGKDPFSQSLAREKLLRMVKRDRSHPCVVIYNMINEQWDNFGASKDKALSAVHDRDMRDAHVIDPSRLITFTSAWATPVDVESIAKRHMRPFDEKIYYLGWWDSHRASGPAVWLQDFYTSPDKHYGYADNAKEVVYWGEEGAISTPPRLEKIKAEVEAMKYPGWDGSVYLAWYNAFADFLERKNLKPYFPTVDALTSAMGAVSLEHQGRKTEDTRICNLNDGYATNGWECEPFENHSGIVDCFRNPKADPAIMAYYNQPLYVAVKVRNQVVQIPGEVIADFYAINEKDLKGAHTLKIRVMDPAGKELFTNQSPVTLQGGDVYGQLLVEGVKIPVTSATGMIRIEAELLDAAGTQQAKGHDEIFAVDWKSAKLPGNGATYEQSGVVRRFLKMGKGLDVPAFDDSQGRLDWIVVTHSPQPEPEVIDAGNFVGADGKPAGLKVTFFKEHALKQSLTQRTDRQLDVEWGEGATPDAAVNMIDGYGVRWEGCLLPPVSGRYRIMLTSQGGVSRLWVNKSKIQTKDQKQGTVTQTQVQLEAGKPVPIRVEYRRGAGNGTVQLLWSPPNQKGIDPARLIRRAQEDGTTLVITDNAGSWAEAISRDLGIRYDGTFKVGMHWFGGQYVVRAHPLFKDLPVNQALNWPYQQVLRVERSRYGMHLEGEELVVGCYNSTQCELGTAVGVVPCGKGRVVFSTLEISPHLRESAGPADVARKLLCNYIQFAGTGDAAGQ